VATLAGSNARYMRAPGSALGADSGSKESARLRGASRHDDEKTKAKSILITPMAANAPRQPTTSTNDGARTAASTPPPGTPVCLVPIAVARSSR